MKRAVWIFLLAVLLPVLALAALALRAARHEEAFLERQLEESARAQVALVVSDAEAELNEMRQEFAAIFRTVDLASHDLRSVSRACRAFQQKHPFARLLFLLDSDGTILLTVGPSSPETEATRKPAPTDEQRLKEEKSDAGARDDFTARNRMAELERRVVEHSAAEPPPPYAKRQQSVPLQPQQQQPAQEPLRSSADAARLFRQSQQDFFWNEGSILAYQRSEPQLQPHATPAPRALTGSKDIPIRKAKEEIGTDLKRATAKAIPRPPAAPAGVEAATDDKTVRGRIAAEPPPATPLPVESKLQPQLANISGLNPPVVAVPASFRELLASGQFYIPRVTDNQLTLLLCVRDPGTPNRIAGCEVDLSELKARLQRRLSARSWPPEICAAVLDDKIQPVALSLENFTADFRRPLVAEPLSESLPHWAAAIYSRQPAQLAAVARWISAVVALSVLTCLVAVFVGTVLVWRETVRERRLAQQKADFVTNVTHELQTPLANIRLFSEMLGNPTTPPAKQRQYAAILIAETERLSRLINNVLDFSRSDRQRAHGYEMTAIDVAELVRELVETQQPHFERSGLRLQLDAEPSPLTVKADHEAVRRALLNLISNAEKYGFTGDRRCPIEIRVRRRDGLAEIAVMDRGPGVPASEREKIFQPFYRVNDRLNSGSSGTGLGLTLARRIARDHGGDLRYEPREGGGSVFVLSLPLVRTEESANEP